LEHAIGFAYGRTALAAIFSALGFASGDEIVLSPLTCKVVPLVLLSLKLRPVYVDIDPATLNLDARAAATAITPKTRAILFQRTYGMSAGIRDAKALAEIHGIPLIEDCAQCLPMASGDPPPGHVGLAAIYSNNLRKPMPAASGGIAATNDAKLAGEIRRHRDALRVEGFSVRLRLRTEVALHQHLLSPSRYWTLYGLSRRFLSASPSETAGSAIANEVNNTAHALSSFRIQQGLKWLNRLPAIAAHSIECSAEYSKYFREYSVPAAMDGTFLYYFPVCIRRKEELLRKAEEQKVEIIAWPVRNPIFPLENDADAVSLGYKPGMCPQADRIGRELVGLPTEEQIDAAHRQKITSLVTRYLN
jgi:dTDP-4-amino-4,6-dideoxygalactose transaminase